MSDTNQVGVYFSRETKLGVAPDVFDFGLLRYASNSVNFNPVTKVSDEITPSRQISDVKTVGGEASGDIGIQLTFNSYREPLEGVMFSRWVDKLKLDSDSVASLADGSLTLASGKNLATDQLIKFEKGSNVGLLKKVSAVSAQVASVDGVKASDTLADLEAYVVGKEYDDTDIVVDLVAKTITLATELGVDLLAGDWIGLKGKDTSDGYYRIDSVSANKLILSYSVRSSNVPLTAAPDSKARVLVGSVLRNGTERQSFIIMNRYGSHNPITQEVFNGCIFAGMTLNLAINEFIAGTFAIQALNGDFKTGETYSLLEGDDEKVMNCATDVGSLIVNGSEVSAPNWIQTVSLVIDNNLRAKNAIGVFWCS